MAIRTTPEGGSSKRERILTLSNHHKELMMADGADNPKFIPRLAYPHKGQNVIGFYKKEIYGGKDIYIEFCDRNYVPEDPKRTLWKWKYNSHYESYYELSDPHPSTGDRRFLIPTKELVNVSASQEPVEEIKKIEPVIEEVKVEKEELTIDLNSGAGTDIPYSAMTLRDHAAIQWKRPVSQKKWLNELITKQFQI